MRYVTVNHMLIRSDVLKTDGRHTATSSDDDADSKADTVRNRNIMYN